MWSKTFLDAVYGPVELDTDLLALVRTPVVQRLRHVRLSNIDSIDIPSIANLSRFEHVIGVTYLAGEIGFRRRLDRFDELVSRGAALLHDWAITSFGHLVEEALQYVGASFDHEKRLSEIVSGQGLDEVLGANLQIFLGRSNGIRDWARKTVGSDGERLLRSITDHVRGQGRMGKVIAGDIDLDNIDNVYRMAFHMGLAVDRAVPRRLTRSIVDVEGECGGLVFRRDAFADIETWRRTRRDVYQNLMLAERDFVGKMMMLFATVRAYEAGEIRADDWKMVNHEFVTRLLRSEVRDVRDAAARWMTGELWDQIPPCWMSGCRPSYPNLLAFSADVSQALDRPCFSYGIKDKRNRRLTVCFDDGSRHLVGEDASQWLFGVGSQKRKAFTIRETEIIMDLACNSFGAELVKPEALNGGRPNSSVLIAPERLDRIDWDFPGAGNVPGSVHGLHWFPGNFIAQIPAALIQVLSKPNDLVFDPFAGSATTAIEALKLGRRAIVSDRLSPSLLIMEGKLALLQGTLGRRERQRILALLAFEHECWSNRPGRRGEGSDPVLRDWYAPATLSQLRYLWFIVETQPAPAQKVLAAIFSDVLFDCASTEGAETRSGKRRRHHWGWIADNVRPKAAIEHNAIHHFAQRLTQLNAVETMASPPACFVVQQDARRLALPDAAVELVVTSPPYIGVIDYAKANRLLYAWMGWPMLRERKEEIGARFRRAPPPAVLKYLSDMREARNEIHRVLKPGSFCAVVIGASRVSPDVAEAVIASFAELMPVAWGPRERAPTRRRVSERSARDALEYVCVFRKS